VAQSLTLCFLDVDLERSKVMFEKKRRALVVAGHGSHFNGNSAASLTYQWSR
jgi:hypothetical protein